MKKLLILVLLITLQSCLQRPTFPCKVVSVGQSNFNKRGEAGMCVYYIESVPDRYNSSFVDSCGKYTVGDTIKTYK